jgi:predicted RNA-binding Zn ribbon-like protein
VQIFVNTTDGEARELLPAWLAERGIDPGVAELRAADAVREALRELLVANNEAVAPSGAALAVLDRASARARFTLRFHRDSRAELRPLGDGVDGALGAVLAAAFSAIEDGTWARLKACRNCRWAFYDYSRNRAAGWCSMSLCGNRLKTRAYRARRRAHSAG